MRRIGHKGADALVPGNTVASFERAVEEGVDMIEFDVLRAPGEEERLRWKVDPELRWPEGTPLVVSHDWHHAAEHESTSLAEALDAFTRPPLDRVELDCDLKLPGHERELVEALRERDLIERAMVSTMYVESLAAIRILAPELRRGWTYPLVTRAWDRMTLARPIVWAGLLQMRRSFPTIVRRRGPDVAPDAVWAYERIVTPALVAAARSLSVELIAWTVDDADRVAALRTMGVDGICSNDPRILQAKGASSAARAGH